MTPKLMTTDPTTPRKFVNNCRPRKYPLNPPGKSSKLNRSAVTPLQNDTCKSSSTLTPSRMPVIHSTLGQIRSPDWNSIISPQTASSNGTRNPASPNTLKTTHADHAPTGPI